MLGGSPLCPVMNAEQNRSFEGVQGNFPLHREETFPVSGSTLRSSIMACLGHPFLAQDRSQVTPGLHERLQQIDRFEVSTGIELCSVRRGDPCEPLAEVVLKSLECVEQICQRQVLGRIRGTHATGATCRAHAGVEGLIIHMHTLQTTAGRFLERRIRVMRCPSSREP
ncbi:hypothetical protein [Streptomyces sp. NPDC050145]|uniref:hypothetical protein n=1 Tax=Streptomyces sp. NPDC050145 TaxID=3365602 RepID=UPI0037BA80D0